MPCTVSDKLTLTKSDLIGNHYIACEVIQPDEIILTDTSVLTIPGTKDKSILICIGCYKELDLATGADECQKCKWPVCESKCGNILDHANFECKILSENKIEFNKSSEPGLNYFCIQTLRVLLLRERDPELYEKVLKLEGHVENRDKNPELTETIAYVIDFIQNKCKLHQFDEASVKFALGATEINAFPDEGGRHTRAVLLTAAMAAHDCAPNTSYVISNEFNEENQSHQFTNTFSALKLIKPGEIITISYGPMDPNVIERRRSIKGYFFFDCVCERCQSELKELESTS